MTARFSRRAFLGSVPALAALPSVSTASASTPRLPLGQAELGLRITGMELIVVRATARTNWIFVRLATNDGMTGLGEASMGRLTDFPEIAEFFELVRERSPFEIQRYRQQGRPRAAAGDRRLATAFSAVEQAQWDLVGKALQAPTYDLTGGALRHELPAYANINRATADRTPAGFAANARQAVADGFRAIKAAPFDGFPSLARPAAEVEAATELGIACIEAMRAAIGPEVDLKIDVHSNFDVPLAIEVAERLEPQTLSWYEEPVPPTDLASTKAIKDGISQTMAGGEFLFGVEGFAALCREASGRHHHARRQALRRRGGAGPDCHRRRAARCPRLAAQPERAGQHDGFRQRLRRALELRHPGVPVERGAVARRPHRSAGTLFGRDPAGARRTGVRHHAQRYACTGTRLKRQWRNVAT